MNCPVCNGAKVIYNLDVMNARNVGRPCYKCGGKGYIADIDPDGVVIAHKPCQVYIIQKLEMNYPVATLEVHLRTVMKDGQPALNKNKKMRFYLEIVRMTTRPKYRKQGIMSVMLKVALNQQAIE